MTQEQTGMNKILERLETKFDGWFAEFEERPISMGIRVLIVILLLRYIWRAFK